jgi:enoyl-CoA hydratase/carnithine racemase
LGKRARHRGKTTRAQGGRGTGRREEMCAASELRVEGDGAVRTLVINRPEKRNRLTSACLEAVTQAMEALTGEEEVRAVVIRGAGDKAFCAGYDISALPVGPSPETEAALEETPPLERSMRAIRAFPFPVIAMLNGDAFGGGCELAIGCDIRVAARRVKMGMPPAKLGLVYPYTGYQRFLQVLGLSRCLEIFLTGRVYDSEDCLRMGLVNHVVADEALEPFTYQLAEEMAENAPLSLKGTKKALYSMAGPSNLSVEEEARLRRLFIESLKSEDMAEGRRAFLEKRRPRFKGR